MIRKISALLILGMMILCSTVYASESTIEKVIVPVVVDFTGEHEFNLRIEGNTETFTWTNESTHDDESWDVTIYRNFTWDQQCPDSAEAWKNLSMELAASREQCQKIMTLNNESHLIATEYADLREGVGNQGAKLEACKTDLAKAEIDANKYTSCSSDLVRKDSDLSSCKIDLNTANNKSSSNPLLWGGVGLGLGFLLFRKKEAQPQEYKEMGG